MQSLASADINNRGRHFNMFAYVCRPYRQHSSPALTRPSFCCFPFQRLLAVCPVLATQPVELMNMCVSVRARVCECVYMCVQEALLYEIFCIFRQ